MKASSLDLADKQKLNLLAELIADLRTMAPHVNVFLVGAMARDLLLYNAHGIRAARATEDADLALAVADWNDFERLRESLRTSGAFEPHPKVAHKLLYRRRMEVDLIPFGGVERAAGSRICHALIIRLIRFAERICFC